MRAFLLSVGATSRDRAVLATHLGLKVPKHSNKLGKLTSLIEEASDTFGLEQDPNERAVNHIWLLRREAGAGGKASPQRPVRKLSSGSYTKSRSSSLGNAAELDYDSRQQQHGLANHVRCVLFAAHPSWMHVKLTWLPLCIVTPACRLQSRPAAPATAAGGGR